MNKADIGLIGLAVMGENLVLNMESKGFTVGVYNRTTTKVTDFILRYGAGKNIIGTYSLEEFVSALERPRKVMMMVKAGEAVDVLINQLVPLLESGDIIIDGGNSLFSDTERRMNLVQSKGLLYVGTGVSGGEEGALKGPSMMPGGSANAWPEVKDIFQTICARAGDIPCCDWVGTGGAGHFVKMVHNGIEYGDMQLICEAYHIMKDALGLDNDSISDIFRAWNQTELDSYLIEITADILAFKDEQGERTLDYILDAAGQKGTGAWTGITALEEGSPLSLITEAVYARNLSAMKEERLEAAAVFGKPDGPCPVISRLDVDSCEDSASPVIEQIRKALLASKIISYAQGYQLMHQADLHYGWNLNYAGIAGMWRGGCIIRSSFLGKITEAYRENPQLKELILAPYFADLLKSLENDWRKTVSMAVLAGIPVPAMSSALSWFDGIICKRLPANLLQAQRDYFGAHTYERIDRPRGEFFHTKWY